MRGGNPLDSDLKMEFHDVFFAAPTPKKIFNLRLQFVDSMKKNNERGADRKWGSLQVCP